MNSRNAYQISIGIKQIFRGNISLFNKIFGEKKFLNTRRISKLMQPVYYDIIKLSKETNMENDEMYKEVCVSCNKLIKLIDTMIYRKEKDISQFTLYNELSQFTNKREIQTMLEHLFLLNTIHKIAKHLIQPKELILEGNTKFINTYYSKQAVRMVKTWEEAERETPAQQENTSGSLLAEIELTKEQIQLIKESVLYHKLRPNPNQQFYNWYNEALFSYQQVKQRKSTVMINEFGEEDQDNKKVTKSKPPLQIMKMKTKPLYKRIRDGKEIFHNKTRFSTEIQKEFEELEHEHEQSQLNT